MRLGTKKKTCNEKKTLHLCNMSPKYEITLPRGIKSTGYCLGGAIRIGIYVAEGFTSLKALAVLLLAAVTVQL